MSSKINVFMLPSPTILDEERTLNVGGQVLTMRLRKPTPQDEFAAADLARDLVRRYCPDENGEVVEMLPPMGDQTVTVSPSACGFAAQVYVMQGDHQTYTPVEIIMMLMSPEVNRWLATFVEDADRGFRKSGPLAAISPSSSELG